MITDDQIRALAHEASKAGDGEQYVICQRALTTDDAWDHDDWTGGGESAAFYHRLADMTQDEARAECARVIAEGPTKGMT